MLSDDEYRSALRHARKPWITTLGLPADFKIWQLELVLFLAQSVVQGGIIKSEMLSDEQAHLLLDMIVAGEVKIVGVGSDSHYVVTPEVLRAIMVLWSIEELMVYGLDMEKEETDNDA